MVVTTLEDNSSMTTICCDSSIVTHDNKIHQKTLLVVVYEQLTTKNLYLTTKMIFCYNFFYDESQWMVVINKLSSSVNGLDIQNVT